MSINKGYLSLKRAADKCPELAKKSQKTSTEEYGCRTSSETVKVHCNVLLQNPMYDLVSEEESAPEKGILYNMLSQSESFNEVDIEMEEFLRLPPQVERPVQMGGKNMSMLAHYVGDASSKMLQPFPNRQPTLDKSKEMVGGMVHSILTLQEKFKRGVAGEKAIAADDASSTLIEPPPPPTPTQQSTLLQPPPPTQQHHHPIDLDSPKKMVGDMVENIISLKEQFQAAVEVENQILRELEEKVTLQRDKLNKLIEGVNYLQNISGAMSSFNQFK